MRILLLTLSLLFTQELEVQGDLKVSGSIDAQNNPVKNVGVPQSLTDAINGNVLQDALRDDGPFEYSIYLTRLAPDQDYLIYYKDMNQVTNSNWSYPFENILLSLLNDGWTIDRTISYGPITTQSSAGSGGKVLYIFKRPIEE